MASSVGVQSNANTSRIPSALKGSNWSNVNGNLNENNNQNDGN